MDLPAFGTIGNCYAMWDRPDVALTMLRRLETAQSDDRATVMHGRALIHVALGQTDKTLTCLEQCVEFQSSRLVMLRHDWRFAPVAGQARFQAIVDRLGFPRS